MRGVAHAGTRLDRGEELARFEPGLCAAVDVDDVTGREAEFHGVDGAVDAAAEPFEPASQLRCQGVVFVADDLVRELGLVAREEAAAVKVALRTQLRRWPQGGVEVEQAQSVVGARARLLCRPRFTVGARFAGLDDGGQLFGGDDLNTDEQGIAGIDPVGVPHVLVLFPKLRPEVGIAVKTGGEGPQGVSPLDYVHLCAFGKRRRQFPGRPMVSDEMEVSRRWTVGDRWSRNHEAGCEKNREGVPHCDPLAQDSLWIKRYRFAQKPCREGERIARSLSGKLAIFPSAVKV